MNLFIDGQGHYATAEVADKYTVVNSDNSVAWSIVAEGRFANCLKRVASATEPEGTGDGGGYVEVTPLMTQTGPWTPTASGVMGFAIKVNDLNLIAATAAAGNFMQFFEGAGPIFSIFLNPQGTFSFTFHQESAFGNGYVGTSIQGLRSNAWAYLELKWLIHDTAGYYEMRLNGVRVFRWDGRTSGSSFSHSYTNVWTTVRMFGIRSISGLELRMDTFYLWDLAGGIHNDYAGDGTIDYIEPVGVGHTSGWTPIGDTPNWKTVKDIPPDGDTTYVKTTAINTRDTYEMRDIPAGSDPICYQWLAYARKEVEGSASLKPVIRLGGTDYDATAQGISSSAYRYLIQPYDTSPVTGVELTEVEADAMEAGQVKVL